MSNRPPRTPVGPELAWVKAIRQIASRMRELSQGGPEYQAQQEGVRRIRELRSAGGDTATRMLDRD